MGVLYVLYESSSGYTLFEVKEDDTELQRELQRLRDLVAKLQREVTESARSCSEYSGCYSSGYYSSKQVLQQQFYTFGCSNLPVPAS